ncbi:MAG: putative Ig domain-containing protein, partial [Blastocatellia bacterium]|nr:putative Ig domain-containing protein [Blastocatellia bacterium]
LNSVTGAITGTLTNAGAASFTIRATNGSGCTGEQAYALTVGCPTITLTPDALAGGTVGSAYNQAVQASPAGNYTYSVSAGALPNGLLLNSTTGAITGTPTSSGTSSFTVKAQSNDGCFVEKSYLVSITLPSGASLGALYVTAACDGCDSQCTGCGPNKIYGYVVDEGTGALTPMNGFPVSTGSQGFAFSSYRQLAVDSKNLRLYALNVPGNTISAYSIDRSSGALTPLPFSPITLDAFYYSIAVHPSGSPVVVTDNANPGKVISFQITATTAAQAPGSPYAAGNGRAILFSQDGNYFYEGWGADAQLLGFSVNAANGGLTALSGSPFATTFSNPLPLATDVGGRIFTAGRFSNTASVYTTSGGAPTPVNGNPFTSGLFDVSWGLLHPSGYFLLGARGNDTTGVFKVSGTGSATTLSAVAGSPFAGGGASGAAAFNGTGAFLYCADLINHSVRTFSFDASSGALQFLRKLPDNSLGTSGSINGLVYVPLTCPTITLSPGTLSEGTVGSSYNQTVIASPAGSYTYTVSAGVLPGGLTLNSVTGAITGTPTSAGTSNFTIQAVGAGGCSGGQAYTLNIQNAITCPTVTGLGSGSGQVGSTVTINGSGFGGVTTVKFGGNVTAVYTIISDSQITATVPNGAVTGAITIGKAGCADVQSSVYTVVTGGGCVSVAISPTLTSASGATLAVPITVGDLTGKGVQAYDLTLTFDPAVLRLQNPAIDVAETLSNGMLLTPNTTVPGRITVSAFGTGTLTGAGTLLKLRFDVIGGASLCSNITLTSFKFNEGTPCASTSDGRVCVVGGAVSGTVSYAAATMPIGVPGTIVAASGAPAASSTTNSGGAYKLSGLGGGPYVVTPTKTGDVNGISSFDASLVARHVAGVATLSAAQQLAGDASNDGTLSSYDASLIAQTVAGLPNAGIVGNWKFTPGNRNYTTLSGEQTNQDFAAVLVGEVSGNWTVTPAVGSLTDKVQSLEADAVTPISVSLATNLVATVGSTISVPIVVGDLTGADVTSYDFTLVFDSSVLQLQDPPVEKADTLSSNMILTPNATTPGRLVVSAFSTSPLTDKGTLLTLRFRVVGQAGTSSALVWQAFTFKEGTPSSTTTNGLLRVVQPNPVPSLLSLNPTSAVVGSPGFSLIVNGTNFVNGSVVRWNGTDRTTTFISNSQLSARITAADVAATGTSQITVFSPEPGGGSSNSESFKVNLCAYALNPSVQSFGSAGGNGSITLSTSAGCSWAATSNSSWITVTTGANGSGNGVVQYAVAANTAGARQGSLLIGNQSVTISQAGSLTSVSAASYVGAELVPEEIVSAFGSGLATGTQAAPGLPLPTNLLGTTVRVRDQLGTERMASLFYVSPTQVNYLIPSGTAPGAALITIANANGEVATGTNQVGSVAPSLFTATSDGKGLAVGQVTRVKPNGTQVAEEIVRYDSTRQQFVSLPIDLTTADQVFLILYGTGIRFRSEITAVSVVMNGMTIPVDYAGPQGDYVGLDQLNIHLPNSLSGAGEIEVVLKVDGKTANTVRVTIK